MFGIGIKIRAKVEMMAKETENEGNVRTTGKRKRKDSR